VGEELWQFDRKLEAWTVRHALRPASGQGGVRDTIEGTVNLNGIEIVRQIG
jgi:hypothetical protein